MTCIFKISKLFVLCLRDQIVCLNSCDHVRFPPIASSNKDHYTFTYKINPIFVFFFNKISVNNLVIFNSLKKKNLVIFNIFIFVIIL